MRGSMKHHLLSAPFPPSSPAIPSNKKPKSQNDDDDAAADVKPARNTNPGRRTISGRIYDSILGVTCHWCRQKTVEDHVFCSTCTIAFCGNCLRNRHGEDIRKEMLKTSQWVCPKCRGGCGPGCNNCCNCGPCRKAQGLEPTGLLVHTARAAGFYNVHDYLVHLETGEDQAKLSERKWGKGWCITPTLERVEERKEDTKEQWLSKLLLRRHIKTGKKGSSKRHCISEMQSGSREFNSNPSLPKSKGQILNDSSGLLLPHVVKLEPSDVCEVKAERDRMGESEQQNDSSGLSLPHIVKLEPSDGCEVKAERHRMGKSEQQACHISATEGSVSPSPILRKVKQGFEDIPSSCKRLGHVGGSHTDCTNSGKCDVTSLGENTVISPTGIVSNCSLSTVKEVGSSLKEDFRYDGSTLGRVKVELIDCQLREIICIDDDIIDDDIIDDDRNGNSNSNSGGIQKVLHSENFSSSIACTRVQAIEHFRKGLTTILKEPFNSQQLEDMWHAVSYQQPVYRTRETRQGASQFPIQEKGYSYLDHYPDFADKVALAKDSEEKLELLRGFFFWLMHAGTVGAYRPWIMSTSEQNDNIDEDCLEVDGLDCEILAVYISLDEQQSVRRLLNRRCVADINNTVVKQEANFYDLPRLKVKVEEGCHESTNLQECFQSKAGHVHDQQSKLVYLQCTVKTERYDEND